MNTPSPINPGALNWFLIVILGVIWGGAFMSVRLSLEGFGPWSVAALRVLIATIALSIVGAALGQGLNKIKTRQQWLFCGLVGAGATALPFILLSLGQQFVPSAFAGVAMGAVPLLVLPVVAIFSPEEGIGPRRVAGMLLGFVGIAILVGPGAIENSGSDYEQFGRIACLLAAACYACGSVVTRRAPAMPPIAFAAGSLLVATLITVPLALLREGLPTEFPALPTAALVYAALGPTALAAVIRVHVITTAGSLFMSLTSYMVPIWSVILGATLLGEVLRPELFIALTIILLGICLSQSRALQDFLKRR